MTVAAILKAKGDWMVMAEPDTSITEAVERMRLDAIGALLVSTDGRKLLGFLSERDVLLGFANHGAALVKLKVRDVMSPPGPTCSPDDSVRRAMEIMTASRARHLSVLDSNCLCGIVSIGDVVKFLLRDAELENKVLRDLCPMPGFGRPSLAL
ncbi:CBS domain-containing protein [Sphingobium sp. SA2]|uniref:CBS domain-containing protein n=1 Tax=Sphingobium sp. SA2 TaxID=1524832 RepID=UPI0028C1D3D9|nr:CBS domain-containing protein [Sphingobium sp. SA2]MDT7533038.1 CBS domain-containing protein [Sphingobium sp. SA2]